MRRDLTAVNGVLYAPKLLIRLGDRRAYTSFTSGRINRDDGVVDLLSSISIGIHDMSVQFQQFLQG